ncbi:hypothetical protein KSF_095990 [Reticulibacter mediterranei]|uniref:Uncharacterized protein n=1 Tax=Reticulibacter mediterranei TaxID=2778369 RepID=A0A8J3IRP5_9CHLR|nr:hypothetical protein [Reticulibacter mediterranei]GHO99551.1 hypothetical protein KSF_095990 [Reticulibacter mediterranei]
MPYPTPGVGAKVMVGSATVGNIGEWDGGPESEVADTTYFGASGSYQVNTPTIKKFKFNLKGSTDAGDTTGQVFMRNNIGTVQTFKFYIDDTHYWQGDAIIQKVNDKAQASKGVVQATYDVTGTGPATWN